MSPLLAQSFAGELDIYMRSKVILSYTLRGKTNTLILIGRWFDRQLVITSSDSGASLACECTCLYFGHVLIMLGDKTNTTSPLLPPPSPFQSPLVLSNNSQGKR
jgi:hypothetical protein